MREMWVRTNLSPTLELEFGSLVFHKRSGFPLHHAHVSGDQVQDVNAALRIDYGIQTTHGAVRKIMSFGVFGESLRSGDNTIKIALCQVNFHSRETFFAGDTATIRKQS